MNEERFLKKLLELDKSQSEELTIIVKRLKGRIMSLFEMCISDKTQLDIVREQVTELLRKSIFQNLKPNLRRILLTFGREQGVIIESFEEEK